MEMDFNNLVLVPVINALVVGVLAFIGKEAVCLAPEIRNFIEGKVGKQAYEEMMNFGLDAWSKIEEDNRLGDLFLSKAKTFEQLMIKKFPEITHDEINFINKAIAGELNKNKLIIASEINPTSIEAEQDMAEAKTEVTAPATIETAPDVSQTKILAAPAAEAIAQATNTVIINGIEYAPIIHYAQG